MLNKRIISFSLILVLIFLIVGFSTVYAENFDDSIISNDSDSLNSSSVSNLNVNLYSDSSNVLCSYDESNYNLNNGNSISEDSNLIVDDSDSNSVLDHDSSSKIKSENAKTVHTITQDNYLQYFNPKGYLINSLVSENDIINLSGNFSSKSFVFTIPVTVTSLDCDAYLRNCRVAFINVSNDNFKYDAIISNLKIESHVDKLLAIEVNNSNCVKVINNDIFTSGSNGYPISLIDNTVDSIVSNNIIKTIVPTNATRSSFNQEENSNDNSSWQHSGITLLDAYRNQIFENDITVENSYGVYLCYGRSTSDYNNISNNIIRATTKKPSFWAYGIYLMGYHNNIENNTIIGMYRGVSATYPFNTIIGNQIYNVTGEDLNDSSIVGGDYALYAGNNSLVANNSIFNAYVFNSGILVGDNSNVYGNYIQIASPASGIRIGDVEGGSNSRIYNNTIDILSGAGIELYGCPENTEVYENIINSLSEVGASQGSGAGIGILSVYQSRLKRPYNISIYNNTIYTSNDYAINIAQSSPERYMCVDNLIFGKGIIYPMSVEYIPEYGEGNIYELTEETYSNYFDSKGRLKDNVKDGDTLIFSGKFNPKGRIILNKVVNIVGNNALLKDTTVFVNVSNCRIKDLNIVNNGSSDDNCNLWGIYVFESDNNQITGNNITVWDLNTSYGIYLCDSYDNNVSDNNIYCEGNNLVFSLLTYETYNTLFENNDILAVGTSELYPYFETICIDGVHSISELSKTYGVILDFSSDNQFVHNNIEVTSTVEGFQVPYNPSVNILIGLYIYYASNNNNISENNVYVHGHDPFLYGMGSSGDDTSKSVTYAVNNTFKDNNITIEADYFAMGMILRHNSKDTIVEGNYFDLYSNNYTYGLTLEISQGAQVSDNTLNCTGRAGIYAVELYSSWSNNISSNKIYANGSFSEVGLYASSGNVISNNKIFNIGDEINNPAQGPEHPDSVSLINTGILLEKGSNGNTISGNEITTSGNSSIHIEGSVGNTIEGNNLSSSKNGGDASVYDNTGQNKISGNFGSRYIPPMSYNSNNTNNANSKSENGGSKVNNGGSSLSGNADSSGASEFGSIFANLNPNALSSADAGTGDVGAYGETGELVSTELEEVASKSMSPGIAVPIAALLLVAIFCFSFLNAKDEDDEDEEE